MEWTTDNLWLIRLGVALFFLIPLLLWFIGIAFIRRSRAWDKFFVFVAGSDNRLSLSRLQAFLWTLAIFGSFFAAMAIHSQIKPVSQAEARDYEKAAQDAKDRIPVLDDNLKKVKANAETVSNDLEKAKRVLEEARARVDILTRNIISANSNAAADELQKAREALDKAQNDFDLKANLSTQAQQEVEKAGLAVNETSKVISRGSNYNWVEIPAALLALAGIAIGSGVFSSLISAVNNEEKTACITNIKEITATAFNENETDYKDTPRVTSDNLLRITGKDMGSSGKVRLGSGKASSVYAPILFWRSDGSEIIVDVPSGRSYDTPVVDTPNGKLSHEIIDLTTKEKELLDAQQQSAKNAVKNISIEKEAADKNLLTANADLQNLNNKNAAPDEIEKGNKAVEEAQTKADAQADLLSKARGTLVDVEIQIGNLRPGDVSNLRLGIYTYYYEFSDLFRDDKNPSNMDLMKFQMFGWTVVAIFIYSWLFLSNLGNDISSLPLVPPSIVILTGLSQAGYLAGKGVTSIEPNKKQET